MKINVTKPTGSSENLELLTAFKVENNTYIVFDGEKVGSMGLPIIYISYLNNNKLEKIDNTSSEWQNVKNYLKGIINGANFEYVKIEDNLNGDEAFYSSLTLPQASFDILKSRYQPIEVSETPTEVPALDLVEETPDNLNAPAPVEPVLPSNDVPSNTTETTTPVAPPELDSPIPANVPPVEPVTPPEPVAPVVEPAPPVSEPPKVEAPTIAPQAPEAPATPNVTPPNDYTSDKETFLKACENMFDALVSKYQKIADDLTKREQEIKQKEIEIEEKLKNAAAKETVANIAHDNAQKVMDINNFMPTNPNNQTGVI